MELRNFSDSSEDYTRQKSSNDYGRKSNQSFNGMKSARGGRDSKSVNSINTENLHETLIQTFEKFYTQESQSMISAIEKSREEMKDSVVEFFEEQLKYKEQLVKASEGRYTFKRRKGSIFIENYNVSTNFFFQLYQKMQFLCQSTFEEKRK
jgi:hypothetical protein